MKSGAHSPANSHAQRLESVLQLNLTLMLCLAGTIFAAAEGSLLPLLTVPLAVLALFVTDRQGTFALTGPWANACGLAGVLLALGEFFSGGIEARLLAFGHLLIYLTWVLLFQPKHRLQYWLLCALAVLQVATASVLTQALWFGPSLILFVVIALWTLSVFSLYRAVRKSEGLVQQSDGLTGHRRSVVLEVAASANRLSGGESLSRNSLNTEAGQRLLDGRFVAGVGVYAALSMLVAGLFFAFTPRVWVGRYELLENSLLPPERALTGFTEEVRLGDLGEILESADLVMQVDLFDLASGTRIDPDEFAALSGLDAPLFRGVALSRYSRGQWSPAERSSVSLRPRDDAEIRRRANDLVEQRIRLQPIHTPTLFAIHPAAACTEEETSFEPGIREDLMTAVFRRAGGRDRVDRWVSSPFEYRAYSWKPDRKPPGPSFWNRRSEKLMSDYRRGLMQLPAGLDRLRELTAEITEPAPGEPPPTPAELARRCEAYLRDSGQFSYTLNLSIQDPLIDPVEDFLFNRRQGHCEYFATALTLMLRAAGIPSRLVSGFKGGDVNTVTGRYEVRQLHAHAWVEAWADDEWLVLDPTPAGRDATVQAMASSSSYLWTDWNNRLRSVWATATTLTQQQQKNLFYDPVMNTVRNWTEVVREQGIGRGVLPALLSFLRSPRRWFSWEGGLVAFGLGVLLLAVVSGARRLMRWIRRRFMGSQTGRRQRVRMVVPFFERFCRIARQAGAVRSPDQTQREYADAFAQSLSKMGTTNGTELDSRRLIDAFYRIRFGNAELPASESGDLDRLLDDLEHRLKNGSRPQVSP